ncbi:MAG: methyltransferase domain-containing protein, partial [bacterium]|nr:methyltransferase domain-containing protein [bacterium]
MIRQLGEPGIPVGIHGPVPLVVAADPVEEVIAFGAFGHILVEDEPRFVREIRRVLKPGGRFAFVSAEIPPIYSPVRWFARGFNAAIR